MSWKFCANLSFFGARRDRFVEYQPARSLDERLALGVKTGMLQGVELKYPTDFEDRKLVRSLLGKHGMELAAVNCDTKDIRHFRFGSLSARSATARQRAIDVLRESMDVAAEFGARLVSTCPLADGYDYPFQVDHVRAWDHLIESVKAVVAHRSDVALALEYQPHEPHARVLLGNVGKVLHVCAEVGAANLGVNLDVGHAFAAGECPAESAALLARKRWLLYIHSNDNPGDGGDWDMVSGSIHFWEWLELLYTLRTVGYDGWMSADVSPKHMGPVEAYRANFEMIRSLEALLDRIGVEKIRELVSQDGNTPAVLTALQAALRH